MSHVGIRELKTNASKLVRRVREQGEIIDITYYGEVVARLVPVKDIKTSDKGLAELWAEMDRLAQEVSTQWSGKPDAVEAVRQNRRE